MVHAQQTQQPRLHTYKSLLIGWTCWSSAKTERFLHHRPASCSVRCCWNCAGCQWGPASVPGRMRRQVFKAAAGFTRGVVSERWLSTAAPAVFAATAGRLGERGGRVWPDKGAGVAGWGGVGAGLWTVRCYCVVRAGRGGAGRGRGSRCRRVGPRAAGRAKYGKRLIDRLIFLPIYPPDLPRTRNRASSQHGPTVRVHRPATFPLTAPLLVQDPLPAHSLPAQPTLHSTKCPCARTLGYLQRAARLMRDEK